GPALMQAGTRRKGNAACLLVARKPVPQLVAREQKAFCSYLYLLIRLLFVHIVQLPAFDSARDGQTLTKLVPHIADTKFEDYRKVYEPPLNARAFQPPQFRQDGLRLRHARLEENLC